MPCIRLANQIGSIIADTNSPSVPNASAGRGTRFIASMNRSNSPRRGTTNSAANCCKRGRAHVVVAHRTGLGIFAEHLDRVADHIAPAAEKQRQQPVDHPHAATLR